MIAASLVLLLFSFFYYIFSTFSVCFESVVVPFVIVSKTARNCSEGVIHMLTQKDEGFQRGILRYEMDGQLCHAALVMAGG